MSDPFVLERPKTWVVFAARTGQQKLWAWCLHGGKPGFEEMRFTDTDGMTELLVEGKVELLGQLFVVEAGL